MNRIFIISFLFFSIFLFISCENEVETSLSATYNFTIINNRNTSIKVKITKIGFSNEIRHVAVPNDTLTINAQTSYKGKIGITWTPETPSIPCYDNFFRYEIFEDNSTLKDTSTNLCGYSKETLLREDDELQDLIEVN
ncbi:MAG: hypothetical protein JNL74_24050 [Fibrobacteres bacterium]|nr:hypothetical protein [Fibrobacterota bacterium]